MENRSLKAQVYEKQQAKKVYDKAIKEGKRASKLDQHRPNVFQMSVGNIMPKDEVSIEIYYTEMLRSINGEYQFVFPGVVGPRFVGESTSKETTFATPHTAKGVSDTFEYDINVCINAGLIIQKIYSSTHNINTQYPDAESAEIQLGHNNINPSNRDFIINYSLRANKLQSGLLLYEGKTENFFSLMIEPPKKTIKSEIPPREYLFVVDVSGSMMGYPIEVAKSLMKNLLTNLTDKDVFNILLFSADNSVFKPASVAVTKENLKEAFQFLKGGNNYGGGTYLLNALNKAYQLPRKFQSTAKTMIVITDGYVNVEKETFQIIENNLDKANVVTFGIGSGVNRFLLEGMASVGKSETFIATNKQEAYKVAKDFKDYINAPLFTQIQLKANGFQIYDVEPKTIPDVFSERPILVFGKYKGSPNGNIELSGYMGNQKITKTINVSHGKLSKENKALKYLWARDKIKRLSDYKKQFGEDTKKEVIDLGIKYNLATQYTSFVAVDNEIVNKNGKTNTVKQPLPLPKNVSNMALSVGAEVTKIKGKSFKKKSFSIRIQSQINNTVKRKLKIWLRGSFSPHFTKLLQHYNQLRIHINLRGEIVKIEKETNGLWSTDNTLKALVKKLPPRLIIKKNTIITIQK